MGAVHCPRGSDYLEPAEIEIMIKKIAFDIVKRYLEKRLLVIFTGGTVGFAEAMKQIKRALLNYELKCDVLFSKAAAQIHDVVSISKELDAEKVIVEGSDTIKSCKVFLNGYSGIVVGTLTRNSASKLAKLFLDNYATQIIIDSLILGIPVIAAMDAADLRMQNLEDFGLICANEALKKAFEENINVISGYGVKTYEAKDLYHGITSVFICKDNGYNLPELEFDVIKIQRNVVTREDIAHHMKKKCKISISKNALITPLALDIITENNIRIFRE
jgi:hypothetical protein